MSAAATDLNRLPPDVAASMRVQMPPAANEVAEVSNAERKAEAERFLALLDEEAEVFCFQTFDDLDSRKSPKLAAVEHGTLDSLWPWLDAKNKSGAGIFVTINEIQTGAARTIPNVVGVRAVFADFDPPKTAPAPAKYPLPPAWQVETSPGHRHAYWPVDGLSLADFQPMIKAVIARLGADPGINDLTRVMRLPGFFHMKNPATPHLVRLIDVDDRLPYRPDQIAAAFPPKPNVNPEVPSQPEICKGQDDYLAELLVGEDVHGNLLRMVGRMVREGLSDSTIKTVCAGLAVHVAAARGQERAAALLGSELARMIQGAREKGYGPPPPIDPSAITGAASNGAAPEDTSRKLTQGEAESLIAWSWRTNKTLPPAREQFEGSINPKTGRPVGLLRVSVQAGTGYTAPWIALGWRTSAEGFLASVDDYLPQRAASVEEANEKRIAKGQRPADDMSSEQLRAHTMQWSARIQALEVADETAQELLARIGPPGSNNTAPLEVAEVADADGSGFPEPPPAIYELSGARRVLFDHYMSASRYPQPLFGAASVSAILATVMGRNYRFWGVYANLMLVMAGPTGCGKEAPQQLADAALTAAGLSSRIGPGSIVSGAGVEDHMEQCPVTLWLLDEMGKMLGAVAQTDQGRAADIAARLMQLYTRSGGVYRGRGLAGLGAGAVKTIHNPICTVLGASTPEAMKSALSAGDAESGFTGRLSFFATNAMRPARRVPTASMAAIPQAFVDWASVAGRESAAGNLPPSGTVPPAPAFDVPSRPDAQALLDRYSAQVDARLEKLRDPAARSGWVRAFETACKFALIAAVGDDPTNPEVRTEHAQWGVAMADHLASTFALSFADRLGTDRHYDALVRLRSIVFRARDFGDLRYRCVTQRGLMPRSYLVKLAKMRSRDLDDLLTTLREAGEVSSGQLDKDLHGMTGAAYWATRGGQDA